MSTNPVLVTMMQRPMTSHPNPDTTMTSSWGTMSVGVNVVPMGMSFYRNTNMSVMAGLASVNVSVTGVRLCCSKHGRKYYS